MILVDLNQVLISNLMAQTRGKADVKPNKDMIRTMVLNSLRGFNLKFRDQYGQIVLCADGGEPWRRKIFPNYKYSRRKNRDDSDFDWTNIFNIITEIKHELRDNFPYYVLDIDHVEADDIIATLVKEKHPNEKIMIVSGDKDFIQLLQHQNVKQYAPIQKKFLGEDMDPRQFLIEQIIKGDRSDGIPNILSPDDCFVTGEKQKPITKKRLEEFSNLNSDDDQIKTNIKRNKRLIDLDYIPKDVSTTIINRYEDYKVNDRSLLLNYFIENKLKSLMENLSDF